MWAWWRCLELNRRCAECSRSRPGARGTRKASTIAEGVAALVFAAIPRISGRDVTWCALHHSGNVSAERIIFPTQKGSITALRHQAHRARVALENTGWRPSQNTGSCPAALSGAKSCHGTSSLPRTATCTGRPNGGGLRSCARVRVGLSCCCRLRSAGAAVPPAGVSLAQCSAAPPLRLALQPTCPSSPLQRCPNSECLTLFTRCLPTRSNDATSLAIPR